LIAAVAVIVAVGDTGLGLLVLCDVPRGYGLDAAGENIGREPSRWGRSGGMDPVTLIVTALAAGAASALQDGVSAAVKDAYARLKALAKKRFADRPKGELVLAEHHAAPRMWEAPLAAELYAVGAAGDADLVAAAQALMSLVDEAGSRAGKYLVSVREGQGVQVGDHGT
jgi:hypothetical protein